MRLDIAWNLVRSHERVVRMGVSYIFEASGLVPDHHISHWAASTAWNILIVGWQISPNETESYCGTKPTHPVRIVVLRLVHTVMNHIVNCEPNKNTGTWTEFGWTHLNVLFHIHYDHNILWTFFDVVVLIVICRWTWKVKLELNKDTGHGTQLVALTWMSSFIFTRIIIFCGGFWICHGDIFLWRLGDHPSHCKLLNTIHYMLAKWKKLYAKISKNGPIFELRSTTQLWQIPDTNPTRQNHVKRSYLIMGKILKIERFSWLNFICTYRARVCVRKFLWFCMSMKLAVNN